MLHSSQEKSSQKESSKSVMTFDQFKTLPFIEAIHSCKTRYLRQQGWDALTIALGLGPNKHACGRYAGHRELPVDLDTLRSDSDWKIKIETIFKQETNHFSSRKELIHNVYRRILYEIWFGQVISTLQRRFKAWTYTPGNPGYKRARQHFVTISYISDISLCCRYSRKSRRKRDNNYEQEWSD